MTSKLPAQERLVEIFYYDEASGRLFWKYRPEQRKSWNSRWAGREAGTPDNYGYTVVRLTVDGVKLVTRKHRIVYKIITGCEPSIVDHKFGVAHGDVAANLRPATKAQNGWNRSANKKRALPKNVYATGDTFVVKIEALGRRYQKGGFGSVGEARSYAVALADQLHGGFSASQGVTLAQGGPTR